MNPSMLVKLEQLTARHEEVSALLAEPEIIGDTDRFRALSVEYAQLEPVAGGFRAYRRVLDDLASARDMAADSDPDLRALAQDELLEAEARRAEQERALRPAHPERRCRDQEHQNSEYRQTGEQQAQGRGGGLHARGRWGQRLPEIHHAQTSRLSGTGPATSVRQTPADGAGPPHALKCP